MTSPAKPGVQSLERALNLLELIAEAGGTRALSQLAADSGLPLPTIHRLAQTLVTTGFLRKEPSKQYALGPKLIGLGDAASKRLGTWARPHLARLAEATGETANLAVLEGEEIVYVAQAPGRHTMRMFTEPGRRVPAHCTAVGKALLAMLGEVELEPLLRKGLTASTPHTITDPARMREHLIEVRDAGYAMDDGEQEIGVRCLAVAVPGAPVMTAVSVSGPSGRIDDAAIERVVPALHEAAETLSAEYHR